MTKQIINLKDAVNYQEKSIVSKEIMRRPTGTVTLFAFAAGEGLSEHSAPYDALVSVLDGTVRITISGEPFTLKGGESIIMPANEPHALSALEDFKMLLTMIKS